MIWLVIRTIIRHLLRDLEARHTLVYDVAHSLAHDTAYDSPVIRPTPGGKRSACPAFCRRAEHFFTVPPQICDAFYVTICGIFFSALFSIGRPSARFGDPRPLVLPGCPALAGHRSEREPSRPGVCCGDQFRGKSPPQAPPVPACHFCLYTGPHSRNISLTISGFVARRAPQVPAGP